MSDSSVATEESLDQKPAASLRRMMFDEIRRNPVGLLFAGIGSAGTVAAVILALGDGAVAVARPATNVVPPILPKTYLLTMAAFLGATTTAALLAKFVNAVSAMSAYFASIVLACLSVFLVAVVARNQGLLFPAPAETTQLQYLIYWGTVLIFLAVNAERVVRDFRAWNLTTLREKTPSDDEAIGSAAMLALLLLAWVGAVAEGTGMVMRLLLS